MNTETFLKEHNACSEGAHFARKYKTLAEAWDACERSDWLLWAYQRKCATLDNRQLRLFACWCARQNWDKLTDVRSRRAIEVAEAFTDGLVTEHELESARSHAYAAYAAADAAAAAYADAAYAAYAYAAYAYAAYAAYAAAAYAAAAAAADADAAYAYAAYAYAAAYADAAAYAARKKQAVQLKSMIPNPFL